MCIALNSDIGMGTLALLNRQHGRGLKYTELSTEDGRGQITRYLFSGVFLIPARNKTLQAKSQLVVAFGSCSGQGRRSMEEVD